MKLKMSFPYLKRFSFRNLKYMKSFYNEYKDNNDEFVQLVAQLPWKHHITLMQKVKDKEICDIIFIKTNSNLYWRYNYMKKIMSFLSLLIIFTVVVGCDSSIQNEINYDDVPIEDRTYDDVVYDKGYYLMVEDRTSKSEKYYAFNESEKKVIIERTGGLKRSKTPHQCHVLEGTYEGELGNEIVINITKQDNKLIDEKYQKEFQEMLSFSDEQNEKHGYESPSVAISRAKICNAENTK